jgi:protein ImuA
MFHPLDLAETAMHEFRAPAATCGHAALAVLRLAALDAAVPIFWVSQESALYPPGLAWLGLDPARCLFAQARGDAECLGMLEVALRGGMAGVAECAVMSRLAARRLALAAKTGGGIGFVLRHAPRFTATDSNAFATRWLITPRPSPAPGQSRYELELLYAKAGRTGIFIADIKEDSHGRTPPALVLAGRDEQPARRAG